MMCSDSVALASEAVEVLCRNVRDVTLYRASMAEGIANSENSTSSLTLLRTESWQTTDVSSLLVYTDKRGGERAAGVGMYYDLCKQNRARQCRQNKAARNTAQGGRRRGSARERVRARGRGPETAKSERSR